MEYKEIDYETLLLYGKRLGNKYQEKDDNCNSPILYDGLVYKFFLQSPTIKEKLILQLEKLHLKYLCEIRGLFIANGKKGYDYIYSPSPILADKLRTDISFEQRLRYINGLITTRKVLDQNGLSFLDYHSANFLAGDDIQMVDIDSIESNKANNRTVIDRYFLELLISIFMNFDITFNEDNSNLYALFYRFSNGAINLYSDDFDIETIFNNLAKMNMEDADELRSEVMRAA